MKGISVSNLIHYLKNNLDTNPNIQNILVCGEISNFTNHKSGHFYFNLKDDKASIACVMFNSYNKTLNFMPKEGDKVYAKIKTSIFEARGQLQLNVYQMELSGIGDLYLEFEKLKDKLQSLGYFDLEHKKKMPKYPNRIAVLCGDKSAALSDILKTAKRRWPRCKIDIYPILVQGKGASIDIINNLLLVDKMDYDAIVLARGGGSFEDLFEFNNEELAKVIYHLNTFIIAGIGHEKDYTIAEMVADVRASTPTACIEMLLPDQNDTLLLIKTYRIRLIQSYKNNIKYYQKQLSNLTNRSSFKDPYSLIAKDIQMLDYLCAKLDNYKLSLNQLKYDINYQKTKLISFIKQDINTSKDHLNNYKQTLLKDSNKILNSLNYRLQENKANLNNIINTTYNNEANRLKRYTILLNAYGPYNTLDRGYSITFKNGQIIKSISKLNLEDSVTIKLSDGEFKTVIKEIVENGK